MCWISKQWYGCPKEVEYDTDVHTGRHMVYIAASSLRLLSLFPLPVPSLTELFNCGWPT